MGYVENCLKHYTEKKEKNNREKIDEFVVNLDFSTQNYKRSMK